MSTPGFKDIPQNINDLISAHIKLYLEDPAAAHMWDASALGIPHKVQTLLLTTIGRKSGKKRSVPLMYINNFDGKKTYYIIGSKGGNEEDPIWMLNLQADPICEIRVGAPPIKAEAKILTSEERAKVWPKIIEVNPTYAKYQARTEREIPVVELIPIV
ncbi:MAG: nitroreductase family deazaflavin-dependent oxidoreductase [Caulobacterales bacterium]